MKVHFIHYLQRETAIYKLICCSIGLRWICWLIVKNYHTESSNYKNTAIENQITKGIKTKIKHEKFMTDDAIYTIWRNVKAKNFPPNWEISNHYWLYLLHLFPFYLKLVVHINKCL